MVAVATPRCEVRAMQPQDLPAVAALERASYDFPWSEGVFADCLRASHPCWALWVDDELAGYGILSIGAGEAHLLNLCIASSRRSVGLGRYLLGQLLNIVRWHGAQRVFLEVRPSNPRAKALYDSVGFVPIGRRPRYYPALDGREDAIVMALDLGGAD